MAEEAKKETVVISEDEWLNELQRCGESSDEVEGMTLEDIREKFGRSAEWVRQRLVRGVKQGRIKVAFGYRLGLDGRRFRVPLYQLIKAEKFE